LGIKCMCQNYEKLSYVSKLIFVKRLNEAS
jgi:hypothetical protein